MSQPHPHPLVAEIRRIRREGHLTQDDVALVLGVDRRTVNRWECGRTPPTLLLLAAYADLLGYEIVLRRRVEVEALPEITPRQARANRAVLAWANGMKTDDYEMEGVGT